MKLLEFLKKELELDSYDDDYGISKLSEIIDDAQKTLDALQMLKTRAIIKVWRKELESTYGENIKYRDDSFGIFIKGIWVGCWGGTDNKRRDGEYKPYWGFYAERITPNDEQVNMVKEILKECKLDMQVKAQENWMVWNDTEDGVSICTQLYEAAIKLGYVTLKTPYH